MTDFNSQHNRVVWFDIPVQNLDRACAFYRGVLAVDIGIVSFEQTSLAGFRAVILDSEGNRVALHSTVDA